MPADGRPMLGCIADDFTGGTDLGSTLRRAGMRVVQATGLPSAAIDLPPADAIVVALKTRTAPAKDAVDQSSAALRWLRDRGARRFLFKYCSTFDSRPDGNIGPVADALLDELGASFCIACPAFPETGRTVYQGHLFVDDRLLEQSSMAHHPLTPMTDSSLIRLLGQQTWRPVGLVPYPVVRKGEASIRRALADLERSGYGYAVVDALQDGHLRAIGRAVGDHVMVTGASGIARGLPDAYRRAGLLTQSTHREQFRVPAGPTAIVAGSVSEATRRQIEVAGTGLRSLCLDPVELARQPDSLAEQLDRAAGWLGTVPVLVHSANAPEDVLRAQESLGSATSASLVEGALATAAARLVDAGARRLIVAGGETSAAVLERLGVTALWIGPDIAPGVPWCLSLGEPALAVALKSGNFGGPRFIQDALGMLA
jgi:uncharacterized protein YgbK (DUF1537 family)